jgi:hypothetical protein
MWRGFYLIENVRTNCYPTLRKVFLTIAHICDSLSQDPLMPLKMSKSGQRVGNSVGNEPGGD